MAMVVEGYITRQLCPLNWASGIRRLLIRLDTCMERLKPFFSSFHFIALSSTYCIL
jgi:hypothetical protein